MLKRIGMIKLIGGFLFFAQLLWAESPLKNFEQMLPASVERTVNSKYVLEDSSLFAGAAKVKITPDLTKPVWLAGFSPGRLVKGIHDDLWVSAIWIEFVGMKSVIMISLDLIGYLFDEVEAANKMISKRLLKEWRQKNPELENKLREVYGENGFLEIFVSATHNHSGPDTIGLWGKTGQESGKDQEYIAFVREKILECVDKARKNTKPVRFKFGKTNLPELIYDARKPVVKNPVLLSMQAVDYDGNTIATLVNYAVHAEVLNQKNQLISADFPGFLRNRLEEKFGGIALFFPADIGGMQSPKVLFRNFSSAKRYGEKIAKKVIQSLEKENFRGIDKTEFKHKEVLFPITNPRFLQAIQGGIFAGTEKHLKKVDEKLYLPSEIAYFQFGPAEFLCIPGELFPELGHQIREQMKAEYKFLLGLCNNEIGYIVPEEQWKESGYEESMSLGKPTAKTLLDGIAELMNSPSLTFAPLTPD